jgi:hypothetical protein
MKQAILLLPLLLLPSLAPGATITVGSWSTIFKGIDLASGSQVPQFGGEALQQVLCMRVDLTDPDIVLFTTPHCGDCGMETLSENTSHFLEQYQLQAAINGGFYNTSGSGGESPLGSPDLVRGLAISLGTIVSPADNATYDATMMFSSNNTPFYVPANAPPGTNTSGMFTAISGDHPLLRNGVNFTNATPNDLDPRTALGVSADRRYLYLLTIDGRQPGWSDGADFYATAEWLKRFGASDGINLDGGGSTTMVMADCVGSPVRLNRPSYVAAYERERYVGHNFGVYAKPRPTGLNNFSIEPGSTTAVFTWGTDAAATTQVQYGSTTNLGSTTPLDARLKHKHVATLTGLTPGSNYFFKAISTASGLSLTQACQFSTIRSEITTQVFGFSQSWKYTTNNVSGANWTARSYSDAGWMGQGPGLLYVEDANYVAPKGTAMPPPVGQNIPITYYFRTWFPINANLAGASLTLSNFVDDGAVFYLNGVEAYRLRMAAAPTVINNNTLAITYPCFNQNNNGDAATNCPDVFMLSGAVMTNLVAGTNLFAVEVHNYNAGSKDVVFGTSLYLSATVEERPVLNLWLEDNWVTFFWNGEGFTLQQATDPSNPAAWANVPGPVTQSPYSAITQGTKFYRLRR